MGVLICGVLKPPSEMAGVVPAGICMDGMVICGRLNPPTPMAGVCPAGMLIVLLRLYQVGVVFWFGAPTALRTALLKSVIGPVPNPTGVPSAVDAVRVTVALLMVVPPV